MPFIPLATRRRQEVTLGDRTSIDLTLSKQETWYAQDGGRGSDSNKYRFARHPNSMTTRVQPEVPFSRSTIQWRPPSADPDGSAAKRMEDVADFGGQWEGAHAPKNSMPRTRSTPSLAKTDKEFARDLMLERFPLTAELKRWEQRGVLMEQRESAGLPPGASAWLSSYRTEENPTVPTAPSGDLVNFPKYLLMNECHLKQMDIQRYVKDEAAAREAANQLLKSDSMQAGSANPSMQASSASMQTSNPSLQTSKGNPLYMRPAGSLMPTGRNQKSSNPFR